MDDPRPVPFGRWRSPPEGATALLRRLRHDVDRTQQGALLRVSPDLQHRTLVRPAPRPARPARHVPRPGHARRPGAPGRHLARHADGPGGHRPPMGPPVSDYPIGPAGPIRTVHGGPAHGGPTAALTGPAGLDTRAGVTAAHGRARGRYRRPGPDQGIHCPPPAASRPRPPTKQDGPPRRRPALPAGPGPTSAAPPGFAASPPSATSRATCAPAAGPTPSARPTPDGPPGTAPAPTTATFAAPPVCAGR
jgi:hypothetical protein